MTLIPIEKGLTVLTAVTAEAWVLIQSNWGWPALHHTSLHCPLHPSPLFQYWASGLHLKCQRGRDGTTAPQPATQITPPTTSGMRGTALMQETTTHLRVLWPAVSTYIFTFHSHIALKLFHQQLAIVVVALLAPAFTQPQRKSCKKNDLIHRLVSPLYPATRMATSSQIIMLYK